MASSRPVSTDMASSRRVSTDMASPCRVSTDMASSRCGSSSVPNSLEQHLTCSICMQVFDDPVTSTCGHTFCKGCLTCAAAYSDRCPLCKKFSSRTTLDVNIVLKNLALDLKQSMKSEHLKKDVYACAPDEVPCDLCVGVKKRKAQKSCLVCLASLCQMHLEGCHSANRLKGHRLVEPVADLDERACRNHGRPLEMYNRTKQCCVCVLCMEEGDDVVSLEMEWKRSKSELDDTKTEMQQRIQKREEKVKEINKSLSSLKDRLDGEWWSIDTVFTAVTMAVDDARRRALQPLEVKRKAAEKETKEITDDLQKEISELQKAIADLTDLSDLEDPIHFLQTYQHPGQEEDRDWTKVTVDTTTSFGTMKSITAAMMERIEVELEKLTSIEIQRVPQFAVDVKLDPNTAHTRLILSDDETRVSDGGESKATEEMEGVGESPERFDVFGSILGMDDIGPDKSYWEVEVGDKTGWDLGITRGEANRKGQLAMSPDNGYWVTVHYEDKHYAAMTAPPTRLALVERPRKVGVFVDRGEGLVSFYDVTGPGLHIYSFTGCKLGGGELYPYLSPHLRQDSNNVEPLAISPVKLKL